MTHAKRSVEIITSSFRIHFKNTGLTFLQTVSARSPVPDCQVSGERTCLNLHEQHWRRRCQTLATLQKEVSVSCYTEEGGISLSLHWRRRCQTLVTLEKEVSDSCYTGEGGVRLLLHWRRRCQTLVTLQKEVSDSCYTAEGGVRLVTLQKEVSDSCYTGEGGVRLLLHWRRRCQALVTPKREVSVPSESSLPYYIIIENIYSPPLQYQI